MKTPAAPVPVERLYWSGAIVVGASLPHWAQVPIWAPALLFACVGWRLGAALAGWPRPNRAARLVLSFCAFSLVLVQFGTVNGVTAGSALLIVMVALKFLESHTQRDHLVLMIIAYFLVFASLLYPSTLLTGLYLLAFVWTTTIGLLQLGRGGALLPARASAALAGRLLVKAAPVMIILFLLFPRLPGPLWAVPGSASAGTSGLSSTMSPGDITALGLSDQVAFRVEFFGAPPNQQDRYWRGPVLAEFDGRTWHETRRRTDDNGATLEHLGGRTDYRVMLEPGTNSRAFAIDMPASWDAGSREIVMTSDYELRITRRESASQGTAYDVTSYVRYRALEPLTDRERAYYVHLPDGYNPRTRALAAEWRAAGLPASEIIERALRLFREETFYYTLTPPPLGRHTADDFLFATREGFCEHYASAFTILMRAAGIPARVVTGYQGGWLNGLGGYYILRQSDAHAWTEVWLEDEGWVRVDPTAAVAAERISLGAGGAAAAGGDRRGGLPPSWSRELALAWDAANMYWDRWVLGYGPNAQRALLGLLGFARPGASQLIAVSIAALAVFAVAFAAAAALRRRPRGRKDVAARAFDGFVARLARAGVPPRAPSEAPSDYGVRAQRALPSAAPQIGAIVRAYVRVRYEPGAGTVDLERLGRAIRRFKPKRASGRG